MPPRLPQGVSSFIAFYSCSRRVIGANSRVFSLSIPRCLHYLNANKCQSNRTCPTVATKRPFHATASTLASQKNPYDVLSVKPDATASEIKKSYFSLARKYHPDTNPDKNARDKFVEIQDAYDVLKDAKRRAAFDQYGATSQQPGFDPDAFAQSGFGGTKFRQGGFPEGFSGGFSGFQDLGDMFRSGTSSGRGDVFEQLFGTFASGGRAPRSSAKMRGSDIETTIGINFMDACKGKTQTVVIQPVANCGTCSGSGLKEGAKRTTCETCGGSGERTFVINSGFQMASTCDACDGVGSTIPRSGQCSSCGGAGKVRVKKTVQVKIPAGIEDGMTIRVPNSGDSPILGSGPSGDLLVRVNVAKSQTFHRQGSNLYYDARVPFYTALLGGRVRVPTLDGNVDVRIPGGTQPGEEMVLKGRGIPNLYGSSSGDLFVKFAIALPRTLTRQQKELIQSFADDAEGKETGKSSKSKSNESPADSTTKDNADSTASPHQAENKEDNTDDQAKQRATG